MVLVEIVDLVVDVDRGCCLSIYFESIFTNLMLAIIILYL